MKRLLTVLIALTLITSVFPSCFYAEDKTSYTEIFEKDKVIDVKIDIAAADLEDMRNYPQNEEYHITVDGVTVENAGIRTKGNMTLNSVAGSDSERYSYRIKFNKYVKGNKLLGLDEYKEKYYGYIKQIMNTLESFEDRVSELKEIISPYVKNDTTAFYTYDEFDSATKAGTETADTSSGANADKGRGRQFGSGLSVIDCVKDRLENLNKQFSGEASKTTEVSQNGKGGGRGDGMMQKHGGDSNGNNPPQMPGGDSSGNEPPQMPGGGNRKNQSQSFGGSENNSVIRVHVNGHILSFDCNPYIENDSTLVGFRSVTEALGASVEWDEKTKTVTAVRGDTVISLTADSNEAYVNGKRYELAAAPEITNDSLMIPVRFISEQLGMKVVWDADTKLITITSK